MKIGKSFEIHLSWLLWSPWASFAFGVALNAVALVANGNQMPVFVPGGDCSIIDASETLHVCMTHATHLKFLCDWFFVRDAGIYSIGDGFISLGVLVLVPFASAWLATHCTIREK